MSKPWSDLTPREKDARVAAALGWQYRQFETVIINKSTGERTIGHYWAWVTPAGAEIPDRHLPSFTTDRAACQAVLDEIARRGLVERYQNALIAVLDLDMQVYRHEIVVEDHHPPAVSGNRFDADGHAYLWVFSQASPDQVCEAAVKVLETR